MSIILSFLKYNILTSHIYISKLCQDSLYSILFRKNFSAEHIPYCGIQSANVTIISLPKVPFSSQDVSNLYSNEPNCTVSKIFLNQLAYSLSMSTTKIILIISSSTKILYLEDILLKCLPKKIKH